MQEPVAIETELMQPRAPIDPAMRTYNNHGVYIETWRDRTPILVWSGPAGTGKTRHRLERMHACALKYAGMRGLFVRKTRESLTQSVLVTFEEKVLPEGSPIKGNIKRESRTAYYYPNGSVIVCGGMQQSGVDTKARIMSTEYDMIDCEELIEFEETDVDQLCSRLRNGVMPFQQLMAGTNPGPPTHWIKRLAATGRLKLIETKHKDNPAYWNDRKQEWTPLGLSYVEGTLAGLSGILRDRLYLGLWVQAEGVVYPEYDSRVHLIDRFEIPEGWRRIRAMDFGLVNPTVCLWFAIDYDGRMYLYRELYMSNRTMKVHAEQILKLSQGEKIDYTVSDHDASVRATLRECGIGTVKAKKDIDRGIQTVKERFKLQKDGKPRLYIMRDSLVERDEALWERKQPICLVDELSLYSYRKTADGRPVKEDPVDMYDHGCDALRYSIMTLDYQRPPSEPETQEQVEAKKVLEQKSLIERQQNYLQNYGWSSF